MRSPMGAARSALRGRVSSGGIRLALASAAVAIVALPGAGPAVGGPIGLVAAYAFDEGSGTVLHDASGNGHDGTISGATWAGGHDGGALSFNGSNASVDLGRLGTFYQSGFTLEAWVQKAGTKKDVGILGSWTGERPDALGRPPRRRLPAHARQQRPLRLPRLGPDPDRRSVAAPGRHLRRQHRPLLHRRHPGRQPQRHRLASATRTPGASAPTARPRAASSTA